MQRVEPAAGLADVLDDEIAGEVRFFAARCSGLARHPTREPVLVLERVVHLRIRHRPGVEPDVEDVLDAAHRRAPARVVGVGPGQLVDVGPVQVGRAYPEVTLEFIEAAVDVDPRVGGVVGHPHRNRSAPVPVSRDRPVAGTGQPLAELPVLDVLGVPGDLGVEFDHPVPDLGDLDEPRRHRPVDQRVPAPPAVRVGVLVGVMTQQHRAVVRRGPGAVLQISDDLRVRVEHMLTGVVGHGVVEPSLGVDGSDRLDVGGQRGGHVVLAVGRRHVNQPGAVLGADEVGGQYPKRVGRVHEVRERGNVLHVDEVPAGQGGHDLRLVAELEGVGAEAGRRQHVPSSVGRFDDDIVDVGVDGHGLVGRQRPRCRRPYQQVGAQEVLPRSSLHPEAHRERRVLAALVDVVIHSQLVARQRRLVVPAVRQHPVALIGQTLVPQLLEGPDHRLHEAEIECLVVVVEIDPARLAGHIGPPLAGVLEHRRAAGVVELLDAHLLDLGLVGDAELALHLELCGQAVGVPAEAAFDLVAAHGAVPRHDVLDVSGEQVPVVRKPVGERRPVVEDVLRRVVATFDACAEGVAVRPVLEHVGFQRRESGRSGGRLRVGGHVRTSPVPMVQARGRRRAGARAPRYHPACAPVVRRSTEAITGPPVRFY